MGTDDEVLRIGKRLDKICQKKEVCFVMSFVFLFVFGVLISIRISVPFFNLTLGERFSATALCILVY